MTNLTLKSKLVAFIALACCTILSGTASVHAVLVYGGGTQTGSRFNPGAGAITYMNAFTAAGPGSTLTIDDITVGIRRGPTAGFLTEVGVNIYAAEMTFDGVNFGRGTNTLVHSTTLAASASAVFVTELVATPLLSTVLNLETASNPGLGGWWVGVEFTGVNAANTINGWRVMNAPTTGASIDAFGIFNNAGSGIFQAFFNFGAGVPSRMMMDVNGVVAVPEPTSLLLTVLPGIVLAIRRRKA